MSSKSLNYLSEIATQKTNTTGVDDPILEIDPSNGTFLRLLNRVSTGDAPGLPVIAKLQDSNGDDLPVDTELYLSVERPTMESPAAVSTREDNIAPWNSLSTAEQRNEESVDSVKIELKGPAVNVRYKDTLYVNLNSSKQIDWSNSELYFVREGVREQSMEG